MAMVRKDLPVYLLAGEDQHPKDTKIKQIKETYLSAKTQAFNLDNLYAKELTLKNLQEKLLSLPINSGKRVVIIQEAQSLKEDVKKFLSQYVKKPYPDTVLVINTDKFDSKDEFINAISRYAQLFRVKEKAGPDTFALGRQIELRKTDYALKILNQLLNNGEKPERILGGLRYAWANNLSNMAITRRRMKLLLNCDLSIKTGKLKPAFALEKLVIGLTAQPSKP